jgi:hypothetical protein
MKKILYALLLVPTVVLAQETEEPFWALSLDAGVTDDILASEFYTQLSSSIQVSGNLKEANAQDVQIGLSREFSFSEKPRRARLGVEYARLKSEPVVTRLGKVSTITPLDLTLDIALLEGGYRFFQSDERSFELWGSVATGITSFRNNGTVTIGSCRCLERTNEIDVVVRPSLEVLYRINDSLRIGLEVSHYWFEEKEVADLYPRTQWEFINFNAISATLRLNF